MEFRGFVHQKSLNALSQYDPFVYFEELQDTSIRNEIVQKIQTFFQEEVRVRKLLPTND